MKLLFAIFILGVSASVFAQDAPPTPPTPPIPPTPPRVAVIPAFGADIIVQGAKKQAPFTADERGESVKVLADGNRVVQSWSGKIARNSEGRVRRDLTNGQVGDNAAGPMIFGASAGGVTPMALSKIDAESGATRGIMVAPTAATSYTTVTGTSEEGRHVIVSSAESPTVPEAAARAETLVASMATAQRSNDGKVQTRKESLGTRDFGGVQAEGTRVITTFAAGAIGNEREFEVTSESWFSKDLGMIVYSKKNDPRTGEQTYQMTNIVRAEPDASLFTKNR